MIREVQEFWNSLEKKKLKLVAEHFGLSLPAVKKYVQMTETEIESMDKPQNYKKRKDSTMDDWLNIIFKMMADGHSSETIFFYIRDHTDYAGNAKKLGKYIYLIGKNNFPERIQFNEKLLLEQVLPQGVISFQRTEILKYLLTCNPKGTKNEELEKYIDVIKEKYPVAIYVETVFKEFHGIIMGNDPEQLETFLEKYDKGRLSAFCNGIKRDIAPVKNAISHPESSGFVEGNNNKFKLLKRIVYGRSGLVNLAKKCKLAFMPKDANFNLNLLL